FGGLGANTLSYESSLQAVLINLGNGQAMGGDAEGDTFQDFANVRGSMSDDALFGDGNANRIDGFIGADYLYGGGNSDTFVFHPYLPEGPLLFPYLGDQTVADFQVGVDKIELDHMVLDYSVVASNMQQMGADTLIQ